MTTLIPNGIKFSHLMALAEHAGVTTPTSANLEDGADYDVSWSVSADVFTEWLCWLKPDVVVSTSRGQHFVHDAHLDRVDRLRVAVFTYGAAS